MKDVKKVIAVVIFFLTNILFALFCRNIYSNYSVAFENTQYFIALLIFLFISIALSVVALSILALFLRPYKILVVVIGFFGLMLPLIIGLESIFVAIVFLLYFLGGLLFSRGVTKDTATRIKFSLESAKQGRGVLIAVFIIVFSLSFGLGYRESAKDGDYLIPATLKDLLAANITETVVDNIDVGDLSEEEAEAALAEARKELESIIVQKEEEFASTNDYIWLVPVFAMSTVLNAFQFMIIFVAQGLILLIFTLLKKFNLLDIKEKSVTKEEITF